MGRLSAAALTVAALSATMGAAGAQETEAGVAVLDHGVRKFFRDAAAPGEFRGSERERGTADVQFVYRAPPVASVLGARPNARLQLNTGGRTSFAALGAEWRQHAFRDRVYAQLGFGVAVHDGFRSMPDPSASGLDASERRRRTQLSATRTGFGSRVLFNPNASLGLRVGERWAVEAAWEHFSHKGLLARRNPGIDTLGVRLVRVLGRR